MSFDPQRAQALFLAALELSDSIARQELLDRECAGDGPLRQRVEDLLGAHGATQGFSADRSDSSRQKVSDSTVVMRPGMVLAGRYKLLEAIGEGGMGTVWMAEQKEPVRRRVAIKLVKAGMDSVQVLNRFEAERQALALMDHPNIAKVFDGGMTEQGRPYFVMEFVKGVPFTEYCDQARLSLRERLQLFVPICQAVQHAHQKGIIHRDLKPSNILVCLYDGEPVPKVIDFGLAKATHQSLIDQTLQTALGMMVGTPLYMSPEQAEQNNLDVDTRTDIYSLGVILYELLTGTTPLERQQLREAGFQEMMRLIKEVDPPRPSTRLSGSASLPSVAAQRRIDPGQLRKSLAGDLDWIVMKALEKERGRRYGTANGLARDIDRFLNDEAVEARPPSSSYLLRKFIKRHRVQVLAATTVLAALLLGMAGTIWGLVEARKQRAAAIVSATNERSANAMAQERLRQVERGYELLAGIFTDLDIRDIKQDQRPVEAVLAERLVVAAGQLEGDSLGDPLMVADLQNRLGETLLALGFPDAAITLFEKSLRTRERLLDAAHSDTISSMNNLGLGHQEAGRPELAVPLLERTLELARATLGRSDPKTLVIMNNLALACQAVDDRDKAIALYEAVLDVRALENGKDDADTLVSMNNLAEAYRDAGKPLLSIPLLEEAEKLAIDKVGEQHRLRLTMINNLALAYGDTGNLEKARPLLEETLRIRRSKLGNKHPDTITSMNNLGHVHTSLGQWVQAVPILEEALLLFKETVGYENPNTLSVMNNLALAYDASGNRERALPLYEEALRIRRKELGDDHADTILSMNNLGISLRELGRMDEAVRLMEEAYRGGRNLPFGMTIGNGLLNTYVLAGRAADAARLAAELIAVVRRDLPAESPQLAAQLALYGLLLEKVKAYAEAEPLVRESLAVRTRHQPDDWTTFNTRSLLGSVLMGQGMHAEAEPLLREGYEGLKQRVASILPQGLPRLVVVDRIPVLQFFHVEKKPFEAGEKYRAEQTLAVFPGPADGRLGPPRRAPGQGGPRFPFLFGPRDGSDAAPLAAQGPSAIIYTDPEGGQSQVFDFVNVVRRKSGWKVRFHKDRPLTGITTLNLLYEPDEQTILNEALAYELYRLAGNPSYLTGYVRLMINGQPAGYHLYFEQPNGSFFRRHEINDKGDLYKLIWMGNAQISQWTPKSLWPTRMDIAGRYEKKSHRHDGYQDLIRLIEQLEAASDEAEIWELIESKFEVDQVINYFAVNSLLSHWDGFFNNFFFYFDRAGTGKWSIYPWDQDSTWSQRGGPPEELYQMPIYFGAQGARPGGLDKTPPRDRRQPGFLRFGLGGPFWWRDGGDISRPLLANPEFYSRFKKRLTEMTDTFFTEEVIFPKIEQMQVALEPEVRLRARLRGADEEAAREQLQQICDALRKHLVTRREFVRGALEKAE